MTIPAFKVVSVFDVSQTEGKELPDIAVDALTGNVEQYEDFWRALKLTSHVPVTLEKSTAAHTAIMTLQKSALPLTTA